MSVNVNVLAVPPSVSSQIVTASNANLQQAFTKLVVHDGTNLGYKVHVIGHAESYVFGNTTATPITVINTNVQFTQATQTLNPLSVNFDISGNGLRYIGTGNGTFFVHINLNAISGAGAQQCSFYTAKNGTILSNSKCSQKIDSGAGQNGVSSTIVSLTTNDIITLWMANNTATNSITITDVSFEAFALN